MPSGLRPRKRCRRTARGRDRRATRGTSCRRRLRTPSGRAGPARRRCAHVGADVLPVSVVGERGCDVLDRGAAVVAEPVDVQEGLRGYDALDRRSRPRTVTRRSARAGSGRAARRPPSPAAGTVRGRRSRSTRTRRGSVRRASTSAAPTLHRPRAAADRSTSSPCRRRGPCSPATCRSWRAAGRAFPDRLGIEGRLDHVALIPHDRRAAARRLSPDGREVGVPARVVELVEVALVVVGGRHRRRGRNSSGLWGCQVAVPSSSQKTPTGRSSAGRSRPPYPIMPRCQT